VSGGLNAVVSTAACESYDLDQVRQALRALLAPLGGMERFVRPGMRVLLKPNLLNDAGLERATTTHPAVIRAVAELVQRAGGEVWIGDSPAGPITDNPRVLRAAGVVGVADKLGARLVAFDRVTWVQAHRPGPGIEGEDRALDYFIAPPLLEADLVIDLPKLKTHVLTLYTGAVKNLYGAIPGTRKREPHLRAPGVRDFSPVLVDLLSLVRPRLSILDGVIGLEGNGPGVGGVPRSYGLLAASPDAVALDAVIVRALGYRRGQVLHLQMAQARGLGAADPAAIRVEGKASTLDFARVALPRTHWYYNVPSWATALAHRLARVRPRLLADRCVGCGRCIEVCPAGAISRAGQPLDSRGRERRVLSRPPRFDPDLCVGCLCCVEVCPVGALEPRRNLLVRLIGMGR
jgi:uncharacterized protein (DUF362 family)/NAD-dependent dihydropyrimidine dehydrogenase PreA subunit